LGLCAIIPTIESEEIKMIQLEFDFTEKKPKKRKRKDDSKKGDVFLNCRSCGDAIAPDFYSAVDKRYCKDCY